MFASDDLDVPEYTVIEDDKPDLEMIGLADERYAESEAGKERLWENQLCNTRY